MSDQLRQVMADVFEVDASRIDESTTRESMDEWTSLAHLRLITEIEGAFGVRVSMEQAMALTTFPALAALVSEAP